MEKIKLNTKMIETLFANLNIDQQNQIKDIVWRRHCYLNAETGEVITQKNEGTGIKTDYFQDAIFYDHAFTRYERENLYEDGFWCDSDETKRIHTCQRGSDGWDMFYDEKTGDEKKVWRLVVLLEDEEMEEYDIWFDDQDKSIVLGF